MQELNYNLNKLENKNLFKRIKSIFLYFLLTFITLFIIYLTNNNSSILKKFYSYFLSDNFIIKHVEISGLQNIKEKTILNTLSLTQKSSIYDVNLSKIYMKLKDINYVSEVNIEIKSNNKLKINIIEKTPVGILQKNNNYQIITSDGSIIFENEIHKFSHLPIFTGHNVEKKVNQILSILYELDFYKHIWSITLIKNRRWNLNLKKGLTILLPEKQFSNALKMINNLNKKYNLLEGNLIEIDLRDKKKIIFQPLIKSLNLSNK